MSTSQKDSAEAGGGATRGSILVTGVVKEEDGQFASYCRELETASCGDTVAEALGNLWEAVQVYLDALEETGEIHSVLRDRNIRIDYADEHTWEEPRIRAPLGEIVSAYRASVPILAKAS